MSKTLSLTTSAAEPAWEDAYESLAYTAFALATQAADGPIARMLAEVRGVLGDWDRIETDRRMTRGDAIASKAAVRVADAALDMTLQRLAESVLETTDGDRNAPLYRRLFPQPHERLIALGLDGELPSASVAMAVIDEADDVPAAVVAHGDALRRCLAAGNQALGARAESYAALGRLEARVEAWHETAAAVRHAIREELGAIGERRGLPARWADSFFG